MTGGTGEGWTWRYEAADGTPLASPAAPSFPSQADAESWIGEHWGALLDDGVEQVSLLESGRVAYGPMGLRPE